MPHGGRIERPRHLQISAFIAALAWYFCAKALAASSARGLGLRFDLGRFQPVLEAGFELFLVCLGIALLAAIERRRAPLRLTVGLPARRSAQAEWGEGVALGWGIALACVLPMALGGTLDVRFWTGPRAWGLALVNVIALALFSLAQAIGIFGYAFHRLIDGVGRTRATLLMALLAALYTGLNPDAGGSPGIRVAVALVATILLCLCWIRTHGLWLLWGMHFAWATAVAVLFGLPLGGALGYSSVVEARAFGPLWLTGGDFGPAATLPTLVCLLAAMVVLVRITSDYAWNYTHPPIIPGGYVVDVPPPAAHTLMESAPPPPPPLVQILPSTPGGAGSTHRPE